jgi:hypothetical protein
MQKVTTGKRINNMEWIYREEWRRRTTLYSHKKCENVDTLCITK